MCKYSIEREAAEGGINKSVDPQLELLAYESVHYGLY